ncbi:sulfatase [Streptomyces tendae]|uniref:sulfatase n=1 Tax=Streptomyces tendae TaxID=1932 RepID=UPI0036848B22
MPPPNIVIISLDTVRADVAYSGKMAGIERLRRAGVTFRQAVSSAPLTPVSHATVFTGLQPPNHGMRHLFREQLRRDVPTLAEELGRAGYATGAVVSCPGLNRWYGIDRGFDYYDDEVPLLPDGRDPLSVGDVKLRGLALKRAPLVVERATAWAAGQQGPFMLFAHFFDAHWPYEPPEQINPEVSNPYEGEVAFADHHAGRLLDNLAELGHDPAEMLVVVFSDHGEDLGGWYPNDHAGDRGHPYEEGHGCLLFDATQHVPLIVAGPGLPAGTEVSEQVRLVDIMPTIQRLLDLPATPSDGLDMTGMLHGRSESSRPAYAETFFPEEKRANSRYSDIQPLGAVRLAAASGNQKVVWEQTRGRATVYDLDQDPDEMAGTPLVASITDVLAAPRESPAP